MNTSSTETKTTVEQAQAEVDKLATELQEMLAGDHELTAAQDMVGRLFDAQNVLVRAQTDALPPTKPTACHPHKRAWQPRDRYHR